MSDESNAPHILERRQRAMRRDAIRPTKATKAAQIERQALEIMADFPLAAEACGGTVISVCLPGGHTYLIAYVGACGCLTWAPDCLLDYDTAHAVARRIIEMTDARYLAGETWRQPL